MDRRDIWWGLIFCISGGMLLLLCGCQAPPAHLLDPLPTIEKSLLSSTHPWIEVYFTQPDHPDADDYSGGPDEALAQAIDKAQMQVDVAAYSFNLWNLRDALLRAHRRGVSVRMVTESDHIQGEEIQSLRAAGISVIGDQGQGLMHQKFIIIDGLDSWLGSMNFTVQGAYENDNNLLHIRAAPLAENFTVEFEEMHQQRLFGDDVVRNTPHNVMEINGTRLEMYFAPDDSPLPAILHVLQGAQEEIVFMAFSFTSDPIAHALLEKIREGVTVQGVFDRSQAVSNQGSEWDRLRRAGAAVRLDGNPEKMHHKCMVIDRKITITGSYNFTESAETRNDEHLLIVHDPVMAELYRQEFKRVYRKARP